MKRHIAGPFLVIAILVANSVTSAPSAAQYRAAHLAEIQEWFSHRSILKKGATEARTESERNEKIKFRRLALGLNEDWRFVEEDLQIKPIDEYSSIIDLAVVFKNSKTNEQRSFDSRFYHGLESDEPIPLVDRTLSVPSQGKPRLGVPKTLWGGDFDAICVRPK